MEIRVRLERDEDGWYVASCPSLPGCFSQGRTKREARRNIKEAIVCHLESFLREGAPLPLPSAAGRAKSRRATSSVVVRTAGLLGKQFPPGVIYERRLRHSILNRRGTMSRDTGIDLITIEARRHEPGRPLRHYLAERSGRRAKRTR